MTRPRVVYWDDLPAPYAVERYNELANRGNLDFSVWFSRRTEADRSWEVDETTWRFAWEYVDDPSSSVATAHHFITRCDEVRPDLLLSLYGERQFVIGHAMLKARRVRTAILALASYDSWVRRTWWKEMLKKIIFRSVDAIKVTGQDAHVYADKYGALPGRIFRVTQSTNVERFEQRLSTEERERMRARLGVEGCVFLYVGRFLKTKGLFDLVTAFARVKASHSAITLLLVGDGADESQLRRLAAGLAGVVFVPFVQACELWKVYASADVFVFPTLGDPHGQVIEEAHAARLPVITSATAGDARFRVIDGTSGYVVPAGDAAVLAERMGALIENPALRAAMGDAGAARVRTSWRHVNWAGDFERFVAGALAVPLSRTTEGRLMAAVGLAINNAVDIIARARVVIARARREGVLTAALATVLARVNRAGMWIASLVWRLGSPQLRLVKYGTKHGGWIIPVDLIRPGSVCYAVGIGDDTSFEDDLLRRTEARVWSFDPTPSSIAHVALQAFDPSRFMFCPIGLSDKKETARFYEFPDRRVQTCSKVNLWKTAGFFEAACDTLPGLMARFGHQSLSLLKIAADGSEWTLLNHLLQEGVQTEILCVLFCPPVNFWQVTAMVRKLRASGFHCVARDQWRLTFVHERVTQASEPVQHADYAS